MSTGWQRSTHVSKKEGAKSLADKHFDCHCIPCCLHIANGKGCTIAKQFSSINPSDKNQYPYTYSDTSTATITATPTIDIIAALASEFDVPPICLFSDRYLISKGQNWIGSDCKLNREVIITNKSTRDKITIPFLELDSENASCFSIRPLRWSNDNQYFYFTGRCYEQYGGDEMGSLYQVDIKNEAWNILIHADHYPYYYFSEDGDQLVYVNQHISGNVFESSIEIGMVDISLGKNKRLVLSDYSYNIETPAEHAWSKSSDKFAIILNNSVLNEMRAEEAALIVDFNKMDMWLVEDFGGINLLVNE